MKLEDISNYKSEIYFLCLNILNDLNSAELVCKKNLYVSMQS